MKFTTKKAKRILKNIAFDVLRLAIYVAMISLAVLAICLLISIPEIIGLLIFG